MNSSAIDIRGYQATVDPAAPARWSVSGGAFGPHHLAAIAAKPMTAAVKTANGIRHRPPEVPI